MTTENKNLCFSPSLLVKYLQRRSVTYKSIANQQTGGTEYGLS